MEHLNHRGVLKKPSKHPEAGQRNAWPSPDKKGRPSVLIVDDEPAIRRLFRNLLESEGYVTAEAEDGRAALALLGSAAFELVVCDLFMDGVDGMETITAVHHLYPAEKILVVSGAVDGNYFRMAKALGAADVLAKPVQPQRLLKAVHDLMAQPAVASLGRLA